MDRVERLFYPDGSPKEEIHFRGAKPHGMWRIWHANGQLAEEYEFDDGIYRNCVNRTWYPNGQIHSEYTYVNGEECGRFTVWNEDGSILYRHYAVNGRKLSESRYKSECDKRPDLPRYSDEKCKTERTADRRTIEGRVRERGTDDGSTPYKAPKKPCSTRHDSVINDLLAGKTSEAVAWLNEGGELGRSLGETDGDTSIYTVTVLYELGASLVLVAGLQEIEGVSNETTNHLLVQLPDDPEARKRLFAFEARHAESNGYDGEVDSGQEYLYLKFA